jgi:hypothetical protein
VNSPFFVAKNITFKVIYILLWTYKIYIIFALSASCCKGNCGAEHGAAAGTRSHGTASSGIKNIGRYSSFPGVQILGSAGHTIWSCGQALLQGLLHW